MLDIDQTEKWKNGKMELFYLCYSLSMSIFIIANHILNTSIPAIPHNRKTQIQ